MTDLDYLRVQHAEITRMLAEATAHPLALSILRQQQDRIAQEIHQATHMTTLPDPHQAVRIQYTNYRGETAWRQIRPVHLFYGATQWHPEPQWHLQAYDFEKEDLRSFAMRGITAWVGVATPVS